MLASVNPGCNRLRSTAIVGLAIAASVNPAHAALIGTCTIVVNTSGTMTVNPALTVFGSKQAGGSQAAVTATPNALLCNIVQLLDCFSLSAPAPSGFLSGPSGSNTNLSMATTYRINGGAETSGNTPTVVANGAKTMQIDLTATKTSDLFPAGTYQAQVTVRCE
jgi:hypothetical protein